MPRFALSRPTPLLVAALSVAVTVGIAGCDTATAPPVATPGVAASSTTPSVTAAPDAATDYSGLLLQARDVSDDEDTFSQRTSQRNPNGLPGASVFYVNADDTRAIADTIVFYDDAKSAQATLQIAIDALPSVVHDGTTHAVAVGDGGTMVSGLSADGTKAITVLLFSQNQVLVRLQFDSAVDDPTTEKFVTSVGRMQQVALRVGLAGPN